MQFFINPIKLRLRPKSHTSRPLKKYVLYSMNVCIMNIIQTYYIRNVVIIIWPNQHQVLCFTVIHKSSPVALWDSKVSIVCTLQNLVGSSRSSGYFLPTLLWVLYYSYILLLSHTVFHLLFPARFWSVHTMDTLLSHEAKGEDLWMSVKRRN